MKKPPDAPRDAAQLQLDLEDAQMRLDKLAKLLAAKDEADRLVSKLTAQLAEAKRRAKEAGWNIAFCLGGERRLAAERNGNGS
jgi:ABC-type enterochelin transport system substrate-binding protein